MCPASQQRGGAESGQVLFDRTVGLVRVLAVCLQTPEQADWHIFARGKDFLLQTKLIVQAGGSSLFGGHKYRFTHKTYFFGDFNLDFRHHKSDETILKLLSKFKLRMCFEPSEAVLGGIRSASRSDGDEDEDDDDDDEDGTSVNKAVPNANVTTNYGSCLDMCLASTVEEDKDREHPVTEWACVYESYFSDHKPVWISVKQS